MQNPEESSLQYPRKPSSL